MSVESFHVSRRMFVLLPSGLVVASTNDPRSHEEWLGPDAYVYARGYWDNDGVYVYRGRDFSPVSNYDLKRLCNGLVGWLFPRLDLPVHNGVVVGGVGEKWEPLVRCGTIDEIFNSNSL